MPNLKIFVIPKDDDFIDRVVYEKEEKIYRSDVVIAALNLYKNSIKTGEERKIWVKCMSF